MYYNNYNNLNNITEKVQVTRTYKPLKCIIDNNGNVYTNITINSINIGSSISGASGDYVKAYSNDSYWTKGSYRAYYNFGVLTVYNVLTKDNVLCVLNNINVTWTMNSSTASGLFTKVTLNEWIYKTGSTTYTLYNNKVVTDNNTAYIGEYTYDSTSQIYKRGVYNLYRKSGTWTLKNTSTNTYISPINVSEHETLQTFNNFITMQCHVTIRNSIYSHARLFDYKTDSIDSDGNTTNNTDRYDYLNYSVSSYLNLKSDVILNIQRRKQFQNNVNCNDYYYNAQNASGDWCEYHHANGTNVVSEKLLDQYTRLNGTVVNDFLLSLVKTVNGSVVSNNNFSYLYSDNIYKKLDNISNDFYNLPQNVINNEKSTGGSWYKAYDRFYSKNLIQQLNTYAEYSKLMLNNGNIPYWDVRNGEGLFYESGAIVFECGYNETVTNYTNRVIKFIDSLPTNLNGCEITFVFKSYGDQEYINFSSTIYFENFYNGTIRIIGISQNKTLIVSNDFLKPVFSFTNVDNVYIDNMSFDYNFSNNYAEVINASSSTLEFNNINNVKIISTEISNIYIKNDTVNPKTVVTSCGILSNNSNVNVEGLTVKRCYSIFKGINNSKYNVDQLNLSFDSVNAINSTPIKNNWHLYFKYMIEMQNNSIAYINMERYVVSSSQQFYWRVQTGSSNVSAVNLERGTILNHTHVGLNQIYYSSDNGSIVTPINNQNSINEYTHGNSIELSQCYSFRYQNTEFNQGTYGYNKVSLENLHFYQSVDLQNSQLPIGDIVEWLSVTKYSDADDLWEVEENMWPWGFYPCYEKFYPKAFRNPDNTARGTCISIPINGSDVNDYFYNVQLAIKMGYLINTNSSDYIKNYFAIPSFEPTLVLHSGLYYVRKIKIIKYSEKVEDRS